YGASRIPLLIVTNSIKSYRRGCCICHIYSTDGYSHRAALINCYHETLHVIIFFQKVIIGYFIDKSTITVDDTTTFGFFMAARQTVMAVCDVHSPKAIANTS
uniref:Uncharacterized protein n=1 Tax=Parascaris univalens TaxID=6257 RepID=A0A915BDF7_PARUN